jgi:hypothetical protein
MTNTISCKTLVCVIIKILINHYRSDETLIIRQTTAIVTALEMRFSQKGPFAESSIRYYWHLNAGTLNI